MPFSPKRKQHTQAIVWKSKMDTVFENRNWPNAHVSDHWCAWGGKSVDLPLCRCCDGADAITPNQVWQCRRQPWRRWQLYPAPELGWNVQRQFDHPISQCRGDNCAFHPLHRPEYPGGPIQGHGGWRWTVNGVATNATDCFADFVDLCHEEKAAAETAIQRAQREARERAELEELAVASEVAVRERYAADVKQRASRGLGRGEAPKTLVMPCKWVIGEFKGDECWAWEYTDPKTKKRMCPHTCNRLHPGQAGWHNEWFTNRNWKPAAPPPPPQHRFTAALAPVDARRGARVAAPPAPPPAPAAKPRPTQAPGRWALLADSDSEEDLSAW